MASDKECFFLLELATPVFGPESGNKKSGEPADNNNQDIDINADLEEVVELPSKKQKTSNDSNVKEVEASTSSVILLYCAINANDSIPISIQDCISCLHLSSLEHST
jgi:hypothetical protein